MYCSCLLFIPILAVFSDINAASVHKRGILPTLPPLPSNININIKLGKDAESKSTEPPAPGSHKTVLKAPFNLGSITITTNRKNSTNNEINNNKPPCDPETENVFGNSENHQNYMSDDSFGGKGGAFHGHMHPPPPPHGFGPPPPDFHHHPPPHHHHPHFPHEHRPDCHHEEPFPPVDPFGPDGVILPDMKPPHAYPMPPNKYPETKPSEKYPTPPNKYPEVKPTERYPTPSKYPETKPTDKVPIVPTEEIPQRPVSSSTTENIDDVIKDIFGEDSPTSTKTPAKIDLTDHEQTGEGGIDVRMPINAPKH